MEKLTTREKQVLLELLNNARLSDQEIARRIKTSRPTVVKIRKRLEKKGIISNYTANLDFEKMGMNVSAITFYRWNDFSRKKEMDNNIKYLKKHPSVIFYSFGQGIGSMTMVIISLHEKLADYEDFWKEIQEKGGQDIHEVEVFISSLNAMFKVYDLKSPFICNVAEKLKT